MASQAEWELMVFLLCPFPPPGLHHLHGAPHGPVRLQGPPAHSQAGPGGQAVPVWPRLPRLLLGGHVQQWQQGGCQLRGCHHLPGSTQAWRPFWSGTQVLWGGLRGTPRLPWWLNGEESTCNAEDAGLIPGWGRSLEEGMATTPVFLPGESHGQGSLPG